MANILFQNQNQSNQDGLQGIIGKLRSMGPSNMVFEQMYNGNPEFRKFADSMRGKTPGQAFQEHGLDFNQFRNMRW